MERKLDALLRHMEWLLSFTEPRGHGHCGHTNETKRKWEEAKKAYEQAAKGTQS